MSVVTTLRWLHLTDLHVGQKEQDHGYWSATKQALLADLRRTTTKLGPWDVVVFTGDLAFSGEKEQYEKLDVELREIWALFAEIHPGAKPPILLAVPGNHDLARPDEADPVAAQLLGEKDLGREALWKGKDPHSTAVRAWFRAYETWWDSWRPRDGFTAGLLPGDFAYTLVKDGVRFAFVGMNSAFTHMFGYVKEGQIWVDQRQIKGACGGDPLAWAGAHHFAFLLTHHPAEWLALQARERFDEVIARPGTFTAHFCGHLHESLAKQTRAGRGKEREIWQGASLFGMEKAKDGKIDRKHGYTVGRLEVSDDGRGATTLWPRLGVKRQDGSWAITADTSYELADDLLATATQSVEASQAVPVRVAAEFAGAGAMPRSWRNAVEASHLWPVGGDGAELAQAKRVAGEIVALCWEQWEAAERELPGDPWRDEDLPLRILDRLEAFVPREALLPQETALLVAAPFVREGLFAAGACWMAGARPLDLKFKGADHPARKALEPTHAARPDLIRRMEKLNGSARNAVGFWLTGRALRQCPQLWEDRPRVPHAQALAVSIDRVAKEGGAPWMLSARLVQLARHVGVSPGVFQAEESIDREPAVVAGGVSLRLAALARALSAGGVWALDLRLADDLVADHCGRDDFEPGIARDALRTARWVPGSEGVYRLAQTCAHPVADFVLRDDLVKSAEASIRRLTQDRDACPDIAGSLLDRLPKHLAAEIRIDEGPDGRPRYRVPHVRFQLDHNQIRELLMGEQLYGDPGLAIRELYQNALDACRYRRARVDYLRQCGSWMDGAYEGRIAFRQDVDDAGRPYIECEDNGVGMTPGILEHVFAVAGKRFKDMPEYLEERARWDLCKPPIELYPNSQFGIGVLSYFMLADEVKVWTRRFEPDGRLRDPIVIHISSASGLFRLECGLPEVMPQGGTRVRLFLNKTSYLIQSEYDEAPPEQRDVSCHRVLGELLWVAEFDTVVEEKVKERLHWPACVPSPKDESLPSSLYLATGSAEVWWSTRGDTPLLVDGLRTDTSTGNALVNLCGAHRHKVSVDRKNVLEWDQEWVDKALAASFSRLPNWGGFTTTFLGSLTSNRRSLARLFVDFLIQEDARIPIAKWTHRGIERLDGLEIPVRAIGFMSDDDVSLPGISRGEPRDLFRAWRASVFARTGMVTAPKSWITARHVESLPVRRVEFDDLEILDMTQRSSHEESFPNLWREHLVLHALDILRVAINQRIRVSDIVARIREYAFLGFELDLGDANEMILEDFSSGSDDCASVVDWLLEWYHSTPKIEPSNVDVLALALTVNVAIPDVLRCLSRLGPLGVHAAPYDVTNLQQAKSRPNLLRLLSRDLDGTPPWLTGHIAPVSIFLASHELSIPIPSVMDMLRAFEPLGLSVPNLDIARLESLDSDSLRLLSRDIDGHGPWHLPRGTMARLAFIAGKLSISMGDAQRQLMGLEWMGSVHPPVDPVVLDSLEREEPRFRKIATCFRLEVVRARDIGVAVGDNGPYATPVRIATQLGILPDPLRAAFESLGQGACPGAYDGAILSSFEDVPGNDSATRFRRGRALTRFRVWKPSDEELDAAIARLRPVIDVIIQPPQAVTRRLPTHPLPAGGCHTASAQRPRAVVIVGRFIRSATTVALPTADTPSTRVLSALHAKCSPQACARGLNSGACSPVSGSSACVAFVLNSLHGRQARRTFSNDVFPPFERGSMRS